MVRVPSYRLHKASGRAVVTINGKDYYLGKHGSQESKVAYNRLIREWEGSGRALTFGHDQQQVTIAMLIFDYQEYCRSEFPASGRTSEADRVGYATRFLTGYLDTYVAEFGPVRLRAVRDEMLKVERNGEPLSRSYVNEQVGRIRKMFRWGVQQETVPVGVYQALMAVEGLREGRTTARETEDVEPVSDEIVEATIEHCTRIVADMIRLQRMTGMRPGEVCCLTPAMVDRSGKVWVADLPKHKTAWRGKDRMIYFGPRAQKILSRYLLRDANSPCFSPAESEDERRSKNSDERVTPPGYGNSPGTNRKSRPRWTPGSGYSNDSYRRAIQYAVAKAFPLPEDATDEQIAEWKAQYQWSPNQLRHSAATEIRAKMGLEHASATLGHSDVSTTMVYAERDRNKAIEVALKLG